MKKGSNNTNDEDYNNSADSDPRKPTRHGQATNRTRLDGKLSTTDGSLSTLASKRSAAYSRRIKLSSGRRNSIEFKRSTISDEKHSTLEFKLSNRSSLVVSTFELNQNISEGEKRTPNKVRPTRVGKDNKGKRNESSPGHSRIEPSQRAKKTKRTFVNPNFLSRTSSEISYSKLNKETRELILKAENKRAKAGSENGLRPSHYNVSAKRRSQKSCACANCGKRIQHLRSRPDQNVARQTTPELEEKDEQSNQRAKSGKRHPSGPNSSKDQIDKHKNTKSDRKIVLIEPTSKEDRENADIKNKNNYNETHQRSHTRHCKAKCSRCSPTKHKPPVTEHIQNYSEATWEESKRGEKETKPHRSVTHGKLSSTNCQPGPARRNCKCRHCVNAPAEGPTFGKTRSTQCNENPSGPLKHEPQPTEHTFESNSSQTISSNENESKRGISDNYFSATSVAFSDNHQTSNHACRMSQSRKLVRHIQEVDKRTGHTETINQNESEYFELNLTTSKGKNFKRISSGENKTNKQTGYGVKSCNCGRSQRTDRQQNIPSSTNRHAPHRYRTGATSFNPNRSFNQSVNETTTTVPYVGSSKRQPCKCIPSHHKQPNGEGFMTEKSPTLDIPTDSAEDVTLQLPESPLPSMSKSEANEAKHGDKCECTVCKNRSKCEHPDAAQASFHGPKCNCNICIDKTACETPIQVKCKAKVDCVKTKPCDIAPLLQRPRIPTAIQDKSSSTEECACIETKTMPCSEREDIRTKAHSTVHLLQKPRIPPRIAAGYTSDEDKRIHTYDCTCKICQDPTIEKHPVEIKKKKWKLPWSSSQPVEIKPKPRPVEIKPWKVGEIFQHPRIPLRRGNEPLSPKPSIQSCSCKEKQEANKSSAKEKPRIENTVDRNHSINCVDLGHKPGCTCPLCEKRLICSTKHDRPMKPVEVKPHKISKALQRPKIHEVVVQRKTAGNQPKDASEVVNTKPRSTVNLFQHPRLPTYASTCYRGAENHHEQDCSCAQCIECKIPTVERDVCEESPELQKIQKKPWYVSDFLQHSRISNATDDKLATIRSETGSRDKDVCPCSQTKLERKKAGSRFGSLVCLKLKEPLKAKPIKSWPALRKHFNETITSICQRPRIPQYTRSPQNCGCKEKCKDSSACKVSLKYAEHPVETKPLLLSNLMQHPRIPIKIDRRPQKHQTGKEEECPCSQKSGKSYWNKVRTHLTDLLNSCQRPRILNATDTIDENTKIIDNVTVKQSSLANILQRPRVPMPVKHPVGCNCKTCHENDKCTTSNQLKIIGIKTKPGNFGLLLQRPRIPITIDSHAKIESKSIDQLNPCPCSTTTTNWDRVLDNLIKFLRMCRKPRILQGIKYQPEKSKSEPILTKPFNKASIFQRPRIPSPIINDAQCNCEACQGDSVCKKSNCPVHPVEIKAIDISALLQHPRITPIIDQRAKNEQPEKVEDSCPCNPKEHMNLRKVCAKLADMITACHRPRVGPPPEKRSAKSETAILKPLNFANFFGHPRIRQNIIHSKDCDCLVCSKIETCANKKQEQVQTKHPSGLKLLQRPRIGRLIDNNEKQDQDQCHSIMYLSKKLSIQILQKPRITQIMSEKRKSAGKTGLEQTKTKPTDLSSLLQQPRIPRMMKQEYECNCGGCKGKDTSLGKAHNVLTKPSIPFPFIQKPRITNAIDSFPPKAPKVPVDEKQSCPCKPKRQRTVSLNFFQRPRIQMPIDTMERQVEDHSSDIAVTRKHNVISLFQHPRLPFQEAPAQSCMCNQCREGLPCCKPEKLEKGKAQEVFTKPIRWTVFAQRPRIPNAIDSRPPKPPKILADESKRCPCKPKSKSTVCLHIFQRPRIPMPIDTMERQVAGKSSATTAAKKHNIVSLFQHPRIPFHKAPSQCCTCNQCKEGLPCCKPEKPAKTEPEEILTKPFSRSVFAQRPRIPNAIDSRPPKPPKALEDESVSCPCKPKSRSTVSVNFFQHPRIPMPIDTTERQVAGKSPDITLARQHNIVSLFQHPRISFREAPPQSCTCNQCKEGLPCCKPEKAKPQEVLTKPISWSVFAQRPRIPNAIDSRTPKSPKASVDESEPCPCKPESKNTVSLNFFQRPRIPMPIDTTERQAGGNSSHINLARKHNIVSLFQHPRIPFHEAPPPSCTCNQYKEGLPCCNPVRLEKPEKVKPDEVLTKSITRSAFAQRPRIPNAIDSRPPKPPKAPADDSESCPCKPKNKSTVSLNYFQRPRISMPIDITERQVAGKSSDITVARKNNIVSLFQHPRILFREAPPQSCTCIQCKEGLPCCEPEKSEKPEKAKPQEVLKKPISRCVFAQRPRIPNAIDSRTPKPLKVPVDESESCPCKPKSKSTVSLNFLQRPRIPMPIDTTESQVAGKSSDITVARKHTTVSLFQHPRIPFREVPPQSCTCNQCKEGLACCKPEKPEKGLAQEVLTKPISHSFFAQKPRIPNAIDSHPPKPPKVPADESESCPCKPKSKSTVSLNFFQRPRIPMPIDNTERQAAGKSSDITLASKHNIVSLFQHPRIPFRETTPQSCTCNQCKEGLTCCNPVRLEKQEKVKPDEVLTKSISRSAFAQRPRIPNAIDSRPPKPPKAPADDSESCPCKPKNKRTVSLNFFQRPRISMPIDTTERQVAGKSSDVTVARKHNIVSLFQHPRILFCEAPPQSCTCNQCKKGLPCCKPEKSEKPEKAKPNEVLTKPISRSVFAQRPRIPNAIDSRTPKPPKVLVDESESCPCKPKSKSVVSFNFFQHPRLPMPIDTTERQLAGKSLDFTVARKHNTVSLFQHPRISFREVPPQPCTCNQCKQGLRCCKPEKSEKPIKVKPEEVLTKPISWSVFAQRPRIPNAIDSRALKPTKVPVDESESCPCKPKSKSMVSLNFFQRPRIPMPIDTMERQVAGKSSDITLARKHNIVTLFQHPRIPFREVPPQSCTCNQCKEGLPCCKTEDSEKPEKAKPQEVLTKPISRCVFAQRPRIPNAIDSRAPKPLKVPVDESESCPCKPKSTVSFNFFQRPRLPLPIDTTERQLAGKSSDITIARKHNIASIFQHPRIPFREAPPQPCTCNQCKEGLPCCKTEDSEKPKKAKPQEVLTKPISRSVFAQRPRIPNAIDSHTPQLPKVPVDESESCPCKPKSKSVVSFNFFQRPRLPMPIDTTERQVAGKSSDITVARKHNTVSLFQHPRIPFREVPPQPCTCNQCKEGLRCCKPEKSEEPIKVKPEEVLTKPISWSVFAQRPRIPNAIDSRAPKPTKVPADESESCPCKPKSKSVVSFNFFQRPRLPMPIDTTERQVAGKSSDITVARKHNMFSLFQHPRIPFREVPPQSCTCNQCKEGLPCCKREESEKSEKAKPQEVLKKPISRSVFAQRPRIPNAIDSRTPKPPKVPVDESESCPCKPKSKSTVSFNFFQRPRLPMPIDTTERQIAGKSSDITVTRKHNIASIFQHPRISFREVPPQPCTCNQCKKGLPCCKPEKPEKCMAQEVLTKPISRSFFAQKPRIPNAFHSYPPKPPKVPADESESCPCKPKSKSTVSLNFFQRPRVPMPIDTTERQAAGKSSDITLARKHNIVSLFQHPRIPFRETTPQSCTCNQCKEGLPCCKPEKVKPEEVLTKPISRSIFAQWPRIPNAIDSRPPKPPKVPADESESCPCKPKSKSMVSLNFFQRPRLPMPIDTTGRQAAGKSSDITLARKHTIVSLFQHPRISFRETTPQSCTCNQCKEGLPCCKPEKPEKVEPDKVLTKPISRSLFAQRPRIPNAIDSLLPKAPKVAADESESCPCKPKSKSTVSLNFFQRPRIPMPIDSTERQAADNSSDINVARNHNIGSLFQHPRIPFREVPPQPCTCNQCKEGLPCSKQEKPEKVKPQEALTKPISRSVFTQRPRIPNAIDSRAPKPPKVPVDESESCPCKPKSKSTVSLNFFQRPRILMPIAATERQVAGRSSDITLARKHNIVSLFQHPRIPFRETTPQSCTCNQCKEGLPCCKPKKAKPKEVLTKPLIWSVFAQRPRIPNAIDSRPPKPPRVPADESESCPCKPKSKNMVSLNFFQRPRIPMPIDSLDRQAAGKSSDITVARKHNIVSLFQHPRIPFRGVPPQPCTCNQCQEGLPCCKPEKGKAQEVLTKPISRSVFTQRPRIPNAIDSRAPKPPKIPVDESESCPCKPKSKSTVSLNFFQRPRIPMPIDNTERQAAGKSSDITLARKHNIVSLFQHPRIPFRETTPQSCTCNQCKEGLPCCKPEKVKPKEVLMKPISRSVFAQRPRIPNAIDSRPPKPPKLPADESESCLCKPKSESMVSLNFFQHPRIPVAIDSTGRQAAGKSSDITVKRKHNIVGLFQHPRIPFREVPLQPCTCNQCKEGLPCCKLEKVKPQKAPTKPISRCVFAQRPRIPNAIDSRPSKPPKVPAANSESCPCKPKSKSTVSLNFFQRPRIPMPINTTDRQFAGNSSDVTVARKHNIVGLFQHPRIPFHGVPPQSCTCNQCKDGLPCCKPEKPKDIKPEEVLTKPISKSVFAQRLRIPNAIDSRPPKPPKVLADESESCPCKPKSTSTISLNFFQRPRIPMPIGTMERQVAGKLSDITVARKHNIVSLFQHPRIPFREAPPQPCTCKECKEGLPCHKPEKVNPQEVLTKPISRSALAQRPRIPNAVDSRPPKPPKVPADETESCPCKPKSKSTVSFNFCQRPRIPMPVEVMERQVGGKSLEKCQSSGKIATSPRKMINLLQHPRIPNIISRKCLHLNSNCDCEKQRCAIISKDNTDQIISGIVRTKPFSVFSLFQHPRIPMPSVKRGIARPPVRVLSECVCENKRKMKSSAVKVKPWYISSLCQHPRISTVSRRASRLTASTYSGCCCLNNHSYRQGELCTVCNKSAFQEIMGSDVKLKKKNIESLCQKPRIPIHIDKPSQQAQCLCQNCTSQRAKEDNVRVLSPESVDVHVKFPGIRNIFQHPRIPSLRDTQVRQRLKTKSHLACRIGAGYQHSSPNVVKIKGLPTASVFQHPRIPKHTSRRILKNKACKCSDCQNKSGCEIVHEKSSYNKLKKLVEERSDEERNINSMKDPGNIQKTRVQKPCSCKSCKSGNICKEMCIESKKAKWGEEEEEKYGHGREIAPPAITMDHKDGCKCNICKNKSLCKQQLQIKTLQSKIDVVSCSCDTCRLGKTCQKRISCVNQTKNKPILKAIIQKNEKTQSPLSSQKNPCKRGCNCSLCKGGQRSFPVDEKISASNIKKEVKLEPAENEQDVCLCEDCKSGRTCQKKRYLAGEATNSTNMVLAGTRATGTETIQNNSITDETVKDKTIKPKICKRGCNCMLCKVKLSMDKKSQFNKSTSAAINEDERTVAGGTGCQNKDSSRKMTIKTKEETNALESPKRCKNGCICSVCKNSEQNTGPKLITTAGLSSTYCPSDKKSNSQHETQESKKLGMHDIEFQESFDKNLHTHEQICTCSACKDKSRCRKTDQASSSPKSKNNAGHSIQDEKTEKCPNTGTDGRVSTEETLRTSNEKKYQCKNCGGKSCTHCDKLKRPQNFTNGNCTRCKSNAVCDNHRKLGGATTEIKRIESPTSREKVTFDDSNIPALAQRTEHVETSCKNKIHCRCTTYKQSDRCQKNRNVSSKAETTKGLEAEKFMSISFETPTHHSSCKCKICENEKCKKMNDLSRDVKMTDDLDTRQNRKSKSKFNHQNHKSDADDPTKRHIAQESYHQDYSKNVNTDQKSENFTVGGQCENCKKQDCKLKQSMPNSKNEDERKKGGNAPVIPAPGALIQECESISKHEWNCQCPKCRNDKCNKKAKPADACKTSVAKEQSNFHAQRSIKNKLELGSKPESEQKCGCQNCTNKSSCKFYPDRPDNEMPCCSKQNAENDPNMACRKGGTSKGKSNADCGCSICQDRGNCRNRKKKRWWWFR